MPRSFRANAPAISAAALAFVATVAWPARAQWSLSRVPTTAEFRGLSIVDTRVAWASGMHGTVARTEDGGRTWMVDTIPGASALDLRSIVGLGNGVAIAASAGEAERGAARIYRTADNGHTWSVAYQTDTKGVFLDALAFWDARHGIALSDPVDGHLFLLRTDDGGRTWTRIPPDAIPAALPNEGAFAASGTCLVTWGANDVWIGTGGASASRVYHSSDRGRTWTVSETPVQAGNPASGIFALAFRDARHGVAVGGNYSRPHDALTNVAITDDGGRTWRAARGPLVPAYLSGVSYVAGDTLIATGLAGTARSTDGGDSWTMLDSLPMNAVRFHGPGTGIAAGPRGRLAWSRGAAPTLLVFITVDQMHADYFQRFGKQFTGGLARLRTGAFFTNAYQDHAITETAPGHATTMSGRFPRSTGIASNAQGVVDAHYALLDAAPGEVGASPDRFHGTTLYDWIAAAEPGALALSVSMKDSGAILPLGRAKQSVFWYSTNGNFTTSTYYADTLPAWVRDFNARRMAQGLAGATWNLLRPASAYREPDAVAIENAGQDNVFPHRFPDAPDSAALYIRVTPFMDSLVAQAALAGVNAMHLGAGPQTDVLAVSFSATDYIGHRYGPDSREIHDQLLRLDHTIGLLLDSLYRLRDSTRIIVALTADHASTSYPEISKSRGISARYVDLRPLVQQAQRDLSAAGVPAGALHLDFPTITLDHDAVRHAGLDPDSVLRALAAAARKLPGVARVNTIAQVYAADTTHDLIAQRWAHQFAPDAPVDLIVTLDRYDYPAGTRGMAEHGTPWDNDAHVPEIFYGPGICRCTRPDRVRVADMAPTLAALLGVQPMERLDGRALNVRAATSPRRK